MKFDPITNKIYTDKDQFVKKMHCPYKLSWDQLTSTNTNARKCMNCDHLVIDTATVSDDELLEMVQHNPSTCLKIDLNQRNLKIITNGLLEQK